MDDLASAALAEPAVDAECVESFSLEDLAQFFCPCFRVAEDDCFASVALEEFHEVVELFFAIDGKAFLLDFVDGDLVLLEQDLLWLVHVVVR